MARRNSLTHFNFLGVTILMMLLIEESVGTTCSGNLLQQCPMYSTCGGYIQGNGGGYLQCVSDQNGGCSPDETCVVDGIGNSSSSSLSGADIAGIIIGCILFVCFYGWVFFCYVISKNNHGNANGGRAKYLTHNNLKKNFGKNGFVKFEKSMIANEIVFPVSHNVLNLIERSANLIKFLGTVSDNSKLLDEKLIEKYINIVLQQSETESLVKKKEISKFIFFLYCDMMDPAKYRTHLAGSKISNFFDVKAKLKTFTKKKEKT